MTNYLNDLNQPKPRIDYTLKAVGGSLTAIPGLSDMIDDTVPLLVVQAVSRGFICSHLVLYTAFASLYVRILLILSSKTCFSGLIELLFPLVVFLLI